MTRNPSSTQIHSLNCIAEAEATIAQCVAEFVCRVLDELQCDCKRSLEEKTELFKCLICAAAKKEEAIADVLNALANITLANKGICDSGSCDD